MDIARTLAARAAFGLAIFVFVFFYIPAMWRHRHWEKQFEVEWKRLITTGVMLDSKIEDELCQERVRAWMMRERDDHPLPTIWNGFK